ncbi:MAG TPA: DUF4389 domain-containing protein [Ilumatobacter sp.]|nr:DUF4389 domain-containing protein [Ilumatobacter sp.]
MYPAEIDVQTPDKIANWRPLVQWLLGIPFLILAYALSYVAQILAVVSWFIILFTGKLPEGIANFQCMALRTSMRATAYAGFLHETYPPFEFPTTAQDPGGHPVSVSFVPQLTDRNRLTVGLRFIWAIPALIVLILIAIVASICWFLAFFAVFFTGKWPTGLHAWVMKYLRAATRLQAYTLLLTDEMPPLNFD